jgi:hypothetical protein
MKMPSQPGSSRPQTAHDKAEEILDGYLDAMKRDFEKDKSLNAGYNTFLGIIKRSPELEVLKLIDAMEALAPPSDKSERFAALEALKKRGSSTVVATDREKPMVLGQLKYLGYESTKAAKTATNSLQTIDEVIESKECLQCSPAVIKSLQEAASMGEDKKRALNPKPMEISRAPMVRIPRSLPKAPSTPSRSNQGPDQSIDLD